MALWNRIRNVFRAEALDRELDAEIDSHLAEAQDPHAFGSRLRYREQSHDAKVVVWLDSLRADLAFGWRQLAKHPAATAIAVLSLGLGIGAVTATFRMIDAGFLRALPVRHPERLFFLRYFPAQGPGGTVGRDSFSHAEYLAMRDAVKGQANVLAASFADREDISFGGPADAEKVSRQYVSGDTFDRFGLKPAIGRLFGPEEDEPGADHRVAVISHDYWQRRFGGDPSVLGKSFRYLDNTYTVIGVSERKFTGTSTGAVIDVFLPVLANAEETTGRRAISISWARVLIHLEEGVNPEAALARLRATFQNSRQEAVKTWGPGAARVFVDAYLNTRLDLLPASGGISNFQRDYRVPLGILAATAGLLLLLSCASVANLLTTRAASRAREMALRVSIGAGRSRLIRLLLIESSMLGAAAAAAGVLFAWWSAPFVVSKLSPPDNPIRLPFEMDLRVLAFGAALAFAVTLAFGLLPALHASSASPAEALKGGFNPLARRRLSRVLVVAQVTFCVLVCLVAGLLAASLRRLDDLRLGFRGDRLMVAEAFVPGDSPTLEMWSHLADRASTLPGVESVALSRWALQTGRAFLGEIQVGNRPVEMQGPYIFSVFSGWFEAMGIPLLEGRDFRRGETAPVAIVNERFARRYFEGRSALGEFFRVENRRMEIVGVVRDIRMRELREETRPTAFFPLGGSRDGALGLRLRESANAAATGAALRDLVAAAFPRVRLTGIRRQDDLIQAQTVRERLLAGLASFFGIVALALAGMGLYGVLSYSVSRRVREIAIRMALGERAAGVARRVLRESAMLVAAGTAIGFAVGAAAERWLRSFLFEMTAKDPAVIAAVAAAVAVSAAIAVAAPVSRAVRVDPSRALRVD